MTEQDQGKQPPKADDGQPEASTDTLNTKTAEADSVNENTENSETTKTEVLEPETPASEAPKTENNAEPAHAEADKSKGFDKPAKNQAKLAKKTKPWLLILLLALLLMAAGIAAAGYWFWQQYQQDIQSLNQIQQETQAQIAANRESFERIEQLTLNADQSWRNAVAELETVVVSSAQRMNRQANRSDYRWQLEEALTLSRLAQQRLQLDASAQVAVGLLRSADEIFASLDQAAVLPLRRQLAEDILALQMTQAADINGLYLQLAAISEAIKNLNWQPKPALVEAIAEDANPVEGFWQQLKQVVVVTKLDVPRQASPLLSDFEQWRQNLLLLVQQTQLALLAQNQLLFDAALQQSLDALQIMTSQFDLAAIEENLTQMQASVLNPQWPELNASIAIIENYIAEQQQAAEEQEAQQ